MPKGKHHNKIENRLLQAKQLLEKPLLGQSEKNLLANLKSFFSKEMPALKAKKEATKLKLTEDLTKLNQLNASYRSFVLREIFIMSVPLFLIVCYYKSNSVTDKKYDFEFLSFTIDSKTSKLLLEIATIFIASIGFYYCFNRIVPIQVNLSQIDRKISQVEERLNQNKQSVQETENLLSNLEETYSNVKKKLDSIKPFKLSQNTAMSLTLFSRDTKAQQNEEETSEEAPSARRQLFR